MQSYYWVQNFRDPWWTFINNELMTSRAARRRSEKRRRNGDLGTASVIKRLQNWKINRRPSRRPRPISTTSWRRTRRSTSHWRPRERGRPPRRWPSWRGPSLLAGFRSSSLPSWWPSSKTTSSITPSFLSSSGWGTSTPRWTRSSTQFLVRNSGPRFSGCCVGKRTQQITGRAICNDYDNERVNCNSNFPPKLKKPFLPRFKTI